jgi:gluconate 2-dehydrogenase gamma chain
MNDLHNRRAFLRAALAAGAVWATADLLQVEDALAYAAHQAMPGAAPAFTALTPAQAEVLDAVAGRILPSVDGRPGAREAGAVHFIDRSLATFNRSQRTSYATGVADLNRRAAAKAPGTSGFATLTPTQQDEVLREVEQTPFFQAVRFDVIVGTFALPTWGGNREYAGWHLIGFDHQPRFQAPFGYYDADTNGRR